MARAAVPSRRPPPSAVAAAKTAASSPTPPARVPQRRSILAAHGVRSLPHPPNKGGGVLAAAAPRRPSCACSPTTHPGSFRCALHRGNTHAAVVSPASASAPNQPVSSRLSLPRRASMANPLVRIAAVEGGDQIRRALASLVRPQQHRRRAEAFRRRPSRLSAVSSAAAGDCAAAASPST